MHKLIALVVLVMLILPIASSEDAAELEKYLDCAAIKKVDLVFVFDTTNSMGGEISELRTVANKFATDLEASNIDFQLGLVEFRDFPDTCDGFSCGSQGDFAYQVKGNGTLTSDISTFSSWLRELNAGGGGSPGPEAVLAALRHAVTDIAWRTDAGKAIIVLSDAGPHPDGSCCNVEGDTLEGTVFTLVDQGACVYVVGPDDASLKKIAKDTGGQFYEIRSGLSLKPLLEEITQSLGCNFSVVAETTCENKQLEALVQLVGKETIPYVKGQTEVWMYLDQSGNISRYNLSFDLTDEVYKIEVPDVCGSVEMTFYGRVGERSAAKTNQIKCGTCVISTSIAISNDVGTRENPIPIGAEFELDNGWVITVEDVITNADDMIEQENMFNKEPDSGNQYVLAMITAKNNGTSVDQIGPFYVVGPSAVAYENAAVVLPDPLPYTDVFPGGTIEGYICWEVKSSDAGNLTMYHRFVRPYVFFSLKP